MTKLDWSLLSGPRVSRRTLMHFAAATGAFSLASWLAACGGDDDPTAGTDSPATTPIPSSDSPSPTTGAGSAGTATPSDPAPSETPTGVTTAATSAPADDRRGGELRLGFLVDQVPSMDPPKSHSGPVAGALLPNLFSGLVQFDDQLTLIGDLAEDWEVAEDGLQYTFRLREGLTFHNGDRLIADDIIYSYERTIDPDFASAHASTLDLIEEMTATDDQTVVIRMSETFAPFLAVACVRGPGRALVAVPRRAIEEMGDEQFGLTPVGSGPFMIVPESRELGRGFELVAFDGWHGGRPLLDKITVREIPEPSSIVNALAAGDIDMVNILPPTGAAQVRSTDGLVLLEAPGTNWRSIAMNTTRPPWDDITARMAVAKAIDRQDFIEKVYFGLAVPGVDPIAPAFGWAYRSPETVDNPQAFDLDEALRLAAEAGLDGQQPVLISSTADQRGAEVVRIALQKIGLDVQIEPAESSVITERQTSGNFDFTFLGSSVDSDPDEGFWNFFRSDGPRSVHRFHNDEVDELLAATRTTTDMEERARLFQEVSRILRENAPCAFTAHITDLVAFHEDVKDLPAIPEIRYLEKVWLDR